MPGPCPQQPIPVEALSEYDVQEIHLDGREVLEKPPTPAEHFQRILNRIDFNKSYNEGATCEKAESDNKLSERTALKMWNSVREATRMALTEINAFVDILAVIKEEKYLSVFPVASDPPDQNLALYLAGKKRALSTASDILLKGTERLRRRHSELADARSRAAISDRKKTNSSSDSFHKTLMQLRQEWRLKLHQNSILGDASLRSIGSRFRESGNFEIRESDLVACQKPPNGDSSDIEPSGGVEVVFSRSVEALLNNAQGPSVLNVTIHETGIEMGPVPLWDHVFKSEMPTGDRDSCSASSHSTREKLSQRERLVRVQRLLACREILFTLACEASGYKGHTNLTSSSISFATQDRIITNLFPGVQLTIGLNTKPPVSELSGLDLDEWIVTGVGKTSSNKSKAVCELTHVPTRTYRHWDGYSLGLQLNRLLAAQHRAAWSNLASLPQSACAPVQVPLRYRAAGAHALPALHFNPSGCESSGFSIAVASVAGFAGPATAAWSAQNAVNRPAGIVGSVTDRSDAALIVSQRLPPVSITQDRLALFTEWGGAVHGGASTTGSAGGLPGVSNPFDDSIPGTAGVASVEHMLSRKRADDSAIQSVVGSGACLLDRTIAICKHYYLREKLSELLSDFARTAPVRFVVHWDAVNSAVLTSARICSYAVNYDAYKSWLGISVSHTGVTVHYPDPPRSCYIGTDWPRLLALLTNHLVHTQMHFLDVLVTKILGWTRLGGNPLSGIANTTETGDAPVTVRMFASPSGKKFVCFRAEASTGIRLFVSDPPACNGFERESHYSISENKRASHMFERLHFREVRLQSVMGGSHDVARVEAVMTALT
ncbi:Mediator of RNA polymerase II transcription subunit 17 [Paragonimus skrjabini miyazakii]|uniref:Mediator of RNA polymerase II transcription subunit 17 n=1 Tax=Paragonimus skrjabini miyazakii TaxID=59628 RepID=A0A8S9YR19_9TREM|nr:Mediator of RNA polymerase II transcription subunit 17 [Paragonimus skrjabini miyazakii]